MTALTIGALDHAKFGNDGNVGYLIGATRMSQRANGSAGLRFRANDRAIRRPAQEGRLDERIEDALARGGIEAEKPAGLSRRQSQTGHLIEFGSDPLEQCREVHTTHCARDAPVATLTANL